MADTFTVNKGMIQPAPGSYNDAWGPVLNDQVFAVADTAFGGKTTINVTGVSGPSVTLTLSQYQPPNIIFTGTLSAGLTYSLPPGVGGLWTIYNNTNGAFEIAFGILSSGVNVPQGNRVFVVSDGMTCQFASTAAAGATPTALVGLTPIPGTSAAFTRSDGAPALNLGIAPTWTGSHTFAAALNLLAGGFLQGTLRVNTSGLIDATVGGLECQTAPAGSANAVAASTAFVAASFATNASPAFTGTPTSASTPASGDSSTKIPNTAFVNPSSGSNANGRWRTNPDGSVDQWGVSASSGTSATVTFPLPFPTACESIVASPIAGNSTYNITTPSASNTTFTITIGSSGTQFSWRASGH